MAKRGSRRRSKRTRKATTAPAPLPAYVEAQIATPPARRRHVKVRAASRNELRRRLSESGVKPGANVATVMEAAERIDPKSAVPMDRVPAEVRASVSALKHEARRFHGARLSLAWFPWGWLKSPCADRFGYMSSPGIRAATKLPFNATSIGLMDQLGSLMGDPGRETAPDSPIPAGFTYVGQFVDHDITFDVSSTLDTATDANTIHNMRSPVLDLDSVYGRGPALDPYRYVFPSSGPSTAIRFLVGSNTPVGTGGPAGSAGTPGAMVQKPDFDLPRAPTTLTAIIGDPRNDENLIVSQFHHAMLRFHNRVVDMLVAAGFTGDIFVEAKKIVKHHYQWAVVHDFLDRICGAAVVSSAMSSVVAPINSPFRMPVEFAVAAYRFGHSMIRDLYWVNFNFPTATLGQVFEFARLPRLPVFSNWVVDFNAFFDTGFVVPVNNKARKIDSVLASGLEMLPGFTGMMTILAQRNLRRGLALGLPSGQGMAKQFGVAPMTAAQIQAGLPPNEVEVLHSAGGILLKKTPLWYYILREAAVLQSGDKLGPVGARIVARTFVRMLKREATSFVHTAGFTPSLPSATPGNFTFADLLNFAGVTTP